jgi:hypothetical protein
LKGTTTRPVEKINAALNLSSRQRLASDRPVEFNSLAIGTVRILHLPGEPFVEYQLLAQQLRPGAFVAVAGYGDDFTGYICVARSYEEGGYEPTATMLAPTNEGYVRGAIADLLADRMPAAPVIRKVRRIWDAAPHNAFTDLVQHAGRWFCTFREAPKHVSEDGSIRVIQSADGETWESAALLSEPGKDLRDPKLSLTPDRRLMLLGGLRTWPPKYEPGLHSWVSFSADGRTWSGRERVADDGQWLWRVTWHKGVAYGIGYGGEDPSDKDHNWNSRLYRSVDGVHYEPVVAFQDYPGLTEATLQFDSTDRMYCVHRRDSGTRTALLGTSDPPYKSWTWRDTGFHLGGPTLLCRNGQWWAAGRWVVGKAQTVLARVSFEHGTIEPVLFFPSGGDNSYPALVPVGDDLLMSYYSSHEGKTAIYLARIGFEEAGIPTGSGGPRAGG